MKFIDKSELDKIFNFKSHKNIKENIEKITLIISTPLAEDVYDLFKDYGFKNIIVQHTTLADVDFVADFNYDFYKDLIIYPERSIDQIFQYAFNFYIDNNNPPIFCCCFHKHEKNCKFLLNLNNELYNDNNDNKINVDNLEVSLPHFYHLFPDCVGECQEKLKLDNKKLSLLIKKNWK